MLLISTPYMDLYKDVIAELKKKNYDVDFIECNDSKWDPLNVRGYKKLRKIYWGCDKRFEKNNKRKWIELLNTIQYKHSYDYLFVIDGQSIHPVIFTILKKRNPQLYCVNYLFDTTKGVYRFDFNFRYFDKVATFDLNESKNYGIEFLPIYWINEHYSSEKKYKLFGLGRYNKSRFELFNYLSELSKKNNWNVYIRLQVVRTNFKKLIVKSYIRSLLGLKPVPVPPMFYSHNLATFDSFSPQEFRGLINSSEIIIDTSAPYQDGLTARLMWALGLEKKIITSNPRVKDYNFYTPDQFFLIESVDKVDENSLVSFIGKKYKMTEETRKNISQYELSNWIDILFKKTC